MGLVTDVFWECPGCGTRNNAQVYGEFEDPPEFHVDQVPVSRGLKWNPPCEECGKFQLDDAPEIYTRLPVVPVKVED